MSVQDDRVWVADVIERHCFIPNDHDRGGCVVAGLDFIRGIEWHMAWRTAFEDFLTGKATPLPSTREVSRDDACRLGIWLNGKGREIYGQRQEFQDLLRDHAHLHLCAGDLIERCREHGVCTAEMHQRFLRASEHVLKHLASLYLAIISSGQGCT